MSMITGCPACGTLFKVVPDQLKVSEGWVRCGHCSEVFDATLHLQPTAADEVEVPGGGGAAAADTEPAPLHPAAEAKPDEPPVAWVDLAPARTQQQPAAQVERAPDSSGFHTSLPVMQSASMLTRPAELEDELPYVAQVDSVVSESRSSRPFDEDDDEEPPRLDDPELDDVTFVQQARRRNFWKQPSVQALLVLLGAVLAVLLAAQVAVQERDRLAAAHPDWKPWLQGLCEPLGCKISAPRRIEAIAIDNSGFTRLRPDAYRLSLTLKNQAAQPVAIPALELTLTDGQDQPVLRRVLTPAELGAASDTMAAASDWSASLAVAVTPAAANRVAGYRLLAFYP